MGYIYQLPFNTGVSNNLSLKFALQRNSVSDPIFPRSGSDLMFSVQATPPYSLFGSKDDQFKFVEYHKWRFNSTWYVPLGRAKGENKDRQFVMKLAAKYGFMGKYNPKMEFSPFERFQLGDAGLNNTFSLLVSTSLRTGVILFIILLILLSTPITPVPVISIISLPSLINTRRSFAIRS